MTDEVKTEDAKNLLKRCQEDPLFFSKHVLGGEQPWEKQRRIMLSVRDNPRTVVPSGFGVGKTWTAARVALWFLFSHPHSLVITTAPTWRQVESVLWAEIRRQHRNSKLPLGGELLRTQVKITDDWFAMGLATDEPTRFQGFHSAHLLLVFDEAAGIAREIWDIAEGQMAGAHARWLAIGNPVLPSGPFYDACTSQTWHKIHIRCLDSPNVELGKIVYPKLVTPQWIEDRRREWGESSPMYQSKVLGEFPVNSEFGLFPVNWITEAQELAKNNPIPVGEKFIGADIARSGADSTVFLFREGSVVRDIEVHRSNSLMEVVGWLIKFVEKHKVPWLNVLVDEIGIGSGVIDRLREQGHDAQAVNFCWTLKSRQYLNTRALCYWKVREALNPESENPLAIPEKFSRLATELMAIEHSYNSAGQIQIESKENIKKKLGHSPDQADALAMSFDNPISRIFSLISGRGEGRVIVGGRINVL
jgi:hypothetical protein